MNKHNEIKVFEDKQVRSVWDDKQEKWYISIVDVIAVLTESPNPRKYWSVLKTRLKAEGSQLATNCSQLKMQSADGKYYLTDVADTEQLFRLIHYGAFSYSHSQIDSVVKYIMNQKEHHKKHTFREEYLDFLKKFEIEFKDEYLFNWIEE